MRAQFHLSKSVNTVAVEVVNDADGGVLVKTVTRVGTIDPVDFERAASSQDTENTMRLNKSEARAIASAMMGCAAEA